MAAQAAPVVVGFERHHAAQPDAVGGRLLYNELNCAACHRGETGLPARSGPDLTSLAHRARPAWIEKFLTDHHTTLEDPAPLVHFLTSVAPKQNRAAPPRHVNAERGSTLYHTVGCATCHQTGTDYHPPSPTDTQQHYPDVPFPDLAAKYSLTTLAEFIRDPFDALPDGRMPHFDLPKQDAVDIAGYLLAFNESDGTLSESLVQQKIDPSLAAEGKQLANEANCAACHRIPALKPAPTIPITTHTNPCPTKANLELSTPQKHALEAYLNSPPQTHTNLTNLTLEALNCAACHDPHPARHAYFTGLPDLGDTGRFPPPLDGIGEKLTPAWLAGVLDGKHRVRPYLHTKMPRFGTATAHLKKALASTEPQPLPQGDTAAGQKLLGTLGGYGCITCHGWRDKPSLGVPALDLANLADRLQPGWLHRYLVDPATYRPGTLMPSFFPGGKAANQEILGGDTTSQINAVLAFAKAGKGHPEGFPDHAEGEYELVPTDRPIVQRTFLKDVGTHAVLVGFPEGIHIAYDAATARPALAWRGRFFDAYNTWFSRFAPFETPLGETVVAWPKPETNARFKGYQLAPDGTPTFLSATGDTTIQETFKPTGPNTLLRTLTWHPENAPPPAVTHPGSATHTTEPSSGQLTITYTFP